MPKILCSPRSYVTCLLLLLVAAFVQSSRFAPSNKTVAASRSSIVINWRMHDRFGSKDTNDLIDYHWDGEAQKYDDAYVHPGTWTVDFDVCATTAPQNALKWQIDGRVLAETTCSLSHNFDSLGTHLVKLEAASADGQSVIVEESINLRDLFIVSIGDSFAAGQGTPEKPRNGLHTARWVDKPCHRSSWSGPARAAIVIEKADPHSSVTFISFACTGAGLLDGFLEEQNQGGRKNKRQLEQIFAAAGARTIDALLVSIGGNDVNFGKLVFNAIRLRHAETDPGTKKLFKDGFDTLTERFALMAQRLNNPTNKARIANVFITEYPDLVRDETRDFCDHSVSIPDLLHGISGAESDWALNLVILPLNGKIREEAARWGWNYVDGILNKFGGDETNHLAHGFCADDKRWVNTFNDSWKFQGDKDGTIHPNTDGYLWYAQRLVEAMRANGAVTP